jgi:hypothetical protein
MTTIDYILFFLQTKTAPLVFAITQIICLVIGYYYGRYKTLKNTKKWLDNNIAPM